MIRSIGGRGRESRGETGRGAWGDLNNFCEWLLFYNISIKRRGEGWRRGGRGRG